MHPIQGVIFDIDGTLLDSNDAHARAYQEALEEVGVERPFVQVRRLIGMGSDQLLPILAGVNEDSEEGKKTARRKKEIFFDDYFPQVKPCAGAKELVKTLRKRGIRTAAAVSSKRDELTRYLQRIGIEKDIEVRVAADDVPRSKPAPDVIHVALEKMGLPAEQVLLIGDTPYDIEAAKKAGVRTIGLQTGGWPEKDLVDAIAIYKDPEDLLRNLDSSPIFSAQPRPQVA